MQTQGDAARPAEAGAVGQSSSLRSARFTTIDESQLRQQATRRRSWLIVAAQAAALAAIIGGMIYLGAYLTRPATSDDLYRAVKSQVNSGGAESLATVEAQIDEFLRRFSQDSRAAELHQYQRQIALDRADRQLQITARRGGASSRLLPIERLYLQAVDAAPDSPAAAVSLLESLLALYGDVPDADFQSPGKESEDPERRQRQAQCVELAHRRLKSLRDELADWTEQQLTELRGRLAAAERLTASNPKLAAAMYRAIIDLHQEEAWAAEIVADARQRLSKLENGREDSVEQEVSKGAEIKSQDEG
jgi:serine/threonine-protein kinase